MSKVSYPLKLPVSAKEAAALLAKEDGVSLNQWIAVAIGQKIGAVETASDLLKRASPALRTCRLFSTGRIARRLLLETNCSE